MTYLTNTKNIFFTLAVFVILILLSEGVYIMKNVSPALTHYLIEKAQASALRGNVQSSLYTLSVAAKINIFPQVFQYRGLIPISYGTKINIPEENSQLKGNWLAYIQNLNLKTPSEWALARIFYNLGLIAYRNNQTNLTIPLWQTAAYLEPELGHYHIELANFYFVSGSQEKARNELAFCLKFKYPAKQCQEYIDNSLSKNIPEDIGFLEKGLGEYYRSVSF